MPPKYRAKPTTYSGVRYASKAEAARAEALDMLMLAGHVEFWIGQPKFRLGCPENVYVADFLVIHGPADNGWAGRFHVEDVKGFETQKFKRDKKLWKRYGRCPLHIVKRGKTDAVIVPDEMEDHDALTEGTNQ